MENQPKLNSSKEVIAFLAERFPLCFSAEGEARPLKIGIFQDLVERVRGKRISAKRNCVLPCACTPQAGVTCTASKLARSASTWTAIRAVNWNSSMSIMLASSLKKPKRAFRHSVPNKTPKNVKPPVNPPMPRHAVRAQPVKSLLHVAKAEPRRKTASRAHKLAHSQLVNLVQQKRKTSRVMRQSRISLNCKLARKSKSEQARARWMLPYSKSLKMAYVCSSLPVWR